MQKLLDCRGMLCPQPVLATRDALAAMGEGVLTVVVDNDASRSNVERFAVSQGCSVSVAGGEGEFRLAITKKAGAAPQAGAQAAEAYTCPTPAAGLVYVIPSDAMGHGDDNLGRVLLRAFIKTIDEMRPLPDAIYFYNTGVKVTASDSDLIPPLKVLEAQGVAIFSCGTCLDFFNLKNELRVGTITNMYEIMTAMSNAARVLSPY
ncbi:MAG TPA: sulfurtransferase-like selenium metabolism protein YedF [Desulfurivibrionaceae bacterium]|nr:sulfurtransferase-like selenium metabolism protein YedF [Desulfurivibrionaceae bacterium]